MIEMRINGIALDASTGSPVVMLIDSSGRRELPIWISQEQCRSIRSVLEQQIPVRPMTHDLLATVLDQCDLVLERVIIHTLQDDTYYALLRIRQGEAIKEIDARPSDAIALALRLQAPIWAMEEVIADASISADKDADEEERQAFRQFLSGLSPADFAQYDQNQYDQT